MTHCNSLAGAKQPISLVCDRLVSPLLSIFIPFAKFNVIPCGKLSVPTPDLHFPNRLFCLPSFPRVSAPIRELGAHVFDCSSSGIAWCVSLRIQAKHLTPSPFRSQGLPAFFMAPLPHHSSPYSDFFGLFCFLRFICLYGMRGEGYSDCVSSYGRTVPSRS